jgi:hypothetical protein
VVELLKLIKGVAFNFKTQKNTYQSIAPWGNMEVLGDPPRKVWNSPRVPQQVCQLIQCCGCLWQTVWPAEHSQWWCVQPIDCFCCMTQGQTARPWAAEGHDIHHEFQLGTVQKANWEAQEWPSAWKQ